MKAALENLSKAGAEFYAEAQAARAGRGQSRTGGRAVRSRGRAQVEKKADVVDADFEVVDEEKSKK